MRTDEQLAALTCEGSFTELYNRYSAWVERFARRFLGRNCDDAVQETWLAVHQYRSSFDPSRGSFRSWLSRIVARHCQRHSEWSSRCPTMECEHLQARERPCALELQDVHELLETLPPEDQVVIVMTYLNGDSRKEVAKRLGVSVWTIKNRLDRGLAALRAG